jgi:hypothetical protein
MFANRKMMVTTVSGLVFAGMLAARPLYASPRGTYFHAGDTVAANVQGARLMIGWETLAALAKGQQFKVEKIQGSWVEGTIEVGGKQVTGWVWAGQVTLRERDGQAIAQRETTRRSYSYEPAQQRAYQRYNGGYDRGIPNYARQKTDPLRYQ